MKIMWIMKFSDLLQQALFAMSEIPSLSILNDCQENKEMLRKLPKWLTRKWMKTVAKHTDLGEHTNFATFVEFLAREANIVNNPVFATSGSISFRRSRRAYTNRISSDKNWKEVPTVKGSTTISINE
jgi:hypothetical protein